MSAFNDFLTHLAALVAAEAFIIWLFLGFSRPEKPRQTRPQTWGRTR